MKKIIRRIIMKHLYSIYIELCNDFLQKGYVNKAYFCKEIAEKIKQKIT